MSGKWKAYSAPWPARPRPTRVTRRAMTLVEVVAGRPGPVRRTAAPHPRRPGRPARATAARVANRPRTRTPRDLRMPRPRRAFTALELLAATALTALLLLAVLHVVGGLGRSRAALD